MDDTSVTKRFVYTSDGKPFPDLSNFEPVNEAELVDNWLHAALNVTE